jgi:hypothetical protein
VTTSTTARVTTTATTQPVRQAPRPTRLDDGSLGNRATRLACAMLSRRQILVQLGGPVGPPTPTYPYCQWLVGSDSFLALAVEPGVGFNTATQYVDTLETVHGLGQEAIIANNRYLYFTSGGVTYWLLWQQVGNFSALDSAQLVALAHDVLGHRLPSGTVPPPALGPAGPPVYFAGDSTAAGPEWAWVTEYATSPATRTLAVYQVGSGFVVPSYFDWALHLVAVAAARRPKLVIWMGSANDGQDLLVDSAFQAVGSPRWRAAFGRIVGSTMGALLAEGCKVLWIGEPAMQDPALSSDMRVIDEVYAAEAAQHHGVVFFNPAGVLGGPGGRYTGTIDIDGRPTAVRLDGVHLNIAGSLYLAGFIARYVDDMLGLAPAHA